MFLNWVYIGLPTIIQQDRYVHGPEDFVPAILFSLLRPTPIYYATRFLSWQRKYELSPRHAIGKKEVTLIPIQDKFSFLDVS